MDWDGARNLADLGGVPTEDGETTAYGRLWRSAAPEWMTDAGWRAARAAGLVRVVDLRNERERGRREQHPRVDATVSSGIEVVHAPTEDPDDPAFLEECGPWLDHPRSWAPNMERYPAKLARVFTAIADAPGPVLVHCAGGRDRTGMVASMLLSLAGAEHEAVADHYEQGFREAGRHRGHGLGYDPVAGEWVAGDEAAWTTEELDQALADRRPVLQGWLRDTDVAAYLTGAGLHPEQIQRLRALLRA